MGVAGWHNGRDTEKWIEAEEVGGGKKKGERKKT
jgi:hypothetical protein